MFFEASGLTISPRSSFSRMRDHVARGGHANTVFLVLGQLAGGALERQRRNRRRILRMERVVLMPILSR